MLLGPAQSKIVTTPFERQPHFISESVEAQFHAMHAASRAEPPSSRQERKERLRALYDAILAAKGEFQEAIASDFGWRSHGETLLAEVIPSLTAVVEAVRKVGKWMRPERRPVSIPFLPGSNTIVWQPKGVVLVVSPWNYPLLLTIGPLAAALAAGNRAIVKPSEFTPSTSSLLKHRLEKALGADWVSVATGGPDVAQALCRLPFDQILFTGSTAVGKKVMAAAAENLTPVTLELGGKSPAIVHPDYDLATAANRIARGKLMNAGQTCIAPDYVLVPQSAVESFVDQYRRAVAQLYPRLVDNRDYTALLDQRHYERLEALVADAQARGARAEVIDPGSELSAYEIGAPSARKIVPILLTGVGDEMTVMKEEIFGPLLPVVGYRSIDDAIEYVRRRPRPLALYYFDDSGARVRRLLERTISGGVTINDTIYHIAQDTLPFGGIGPSGMGAYHGRDGFRTFSHAKAVFRQSRFTLTDLLAPPYGVWFDRLTRLALARIHWLR